MNSYNHHVNLNGDVMIHSLLGLINTLSNCIITVLSDH